MMNDNSINTDGATFINIVTTHIDNIW